MHVAHQAAITPLSTLSLLVRKPLSLDIVSVIVIADIIVKEKILTSMSLDSVSDTRFTPALGQQEAHREHIWIHNNIINGFHLRTDDVSSK